MKATIYDKHTDAEPRFTRGVSQTGKRLVREVDIRVSKGRVKLVVEKSCRVDFA